MAVRTIPQILSSNGNQIALVSAWTAPGTTAAQLLNTNGGLNDGWATSPGDGETLEATNCSASTSARSTISTIPAASMPRRSVPTHRSAPQPSGLSTPGESGTAAISWKIYYTDTTTETGSNSVNGNSETETLGDPSKQIAFIEFWVTGGDARINLQSVTYHVEPGTLPDADINEVIFLSDGEPNRALDDDGDVISVGVQEAINQITNETNETEGDGDGGGQDQAFNINAIGLNLQTATLSIDNADDFTAIRRAVTPIPDMSCTAAALRSPLSRAGTAANSSASRITIATTMASGAKAKTAMTRWITARSGCASISARSTITTTPAPIRQPETPWALTARPSPRRPSC